MRSNSFSQIKPITQIQSPRKKQQQTFRLQNQQSLTFADYRKKCNKITAFRGCDENKSDDTNCYTFGFSCYKLQFFLRFSKNEQAFILIAA